MNRYRLLTPGLMMVIAAACQRDATFTEPMPALAAIHWVNAVPDAGPQDMHPVDIPSNAGLYNAAFRDANMFYQPIEAGSRTVRAFRAALTGDPATASTVLTEQTITLNQNASYTFLHTGFSQTGGSPAKEGFLVTDNPPTLGGGQIAIRVINAGAALGNIDVWVVKVAVNAATADSLPDARAASDVAYKGQSAYLTIPADGAGQGTRVAITAAGTKTLLFTPVAIPAGVAGTSTADPIAGGTVAGSVFTAIIVPRSVAGSGAPTTSAFTTPGVIHLVDRRPASTYQ